MRPWKSPEHARYYLLGVYLSDGGLTNNGRFWLRVRDKEFRRVVANALGILKIGYSYGERPVKKRKIFGHSCFAPAAVNFWVRVLSSPEGNRLSKWMRDFTQNKESLPQVLREYLPELVAGVLDGDGNVYIPRDRKRPRISVSGKCGYLPDLIYQVRKLSVRVNGPYLNNNGTPVYRLNTRDFLTAGLFFRMSRKQEKLMTSGIKPWR